MLAQFWHSSAFGNEGQRALAADGSPLLTDVFRLGLQRIRALRRIA